MNVKIVSLEDNLSTLVQEINNSLWDDANEMSQYTENSLRAYLKRQDTIFITCHKPSSNKPILIGIASARVEMKPYNQELWLYVDEVDVCADQRQRGAGKHMLKKIIKIAKERGCEELWLGTEIDNHPANALYQSLDPKDVSPFLGYTYDTKN